MTKKSRETGTTGWHMHLPNHAAFLDDRCDCSHRLPVLVLPLDGLREQIARTVYSFDPAVTPWGGDEMGFDARHWIAEEKRDVAYEVADALLAGFAAGQETT